MIMVGREGNKSAQECFSLPFGAALLWVLRTVISVQYKSQIFALMRFYYRVPAGR